MHAFLQKLTTPPPPLSRRQMLLLGSLSVVVAISRWFALSTSQLDWDESLFAGGVRKYDVIAQNPHPPGYPLFILFAKIVRLAVHDDFRSLQVVAAVASFLLFSATFFLMRELRLRFRIAIVGAVITAFLPTVWYYGGTALSDVPALCTAVTASALLLAGGRNPRAWIAGMFVAGVTGGIRPLHVVIAAVPALAGGAALRRPRTILTGCAVFAVVVAASYIGAALATPNAPWGYLHQIGVTAHHIGSTDSFNNITRPPLRKLAPTFFVYSHRGGRAGLALLALAAIGLIEATIRHRVIVRIVVAMFVPVAIVSWMMFDITAVTRYGIAYVVLYSLAGAHGIDVLARIWKNAIAQNVTIAVAATILVVAMIEWTRPALAVVRHHASPPIAAMLGSGRQRQRAAARPRTDRGAHRPWRGGRCRSLIRRRREQRHADRLLGRSTAGLRECGPDRESVVELFDQYVRARRRAGRECDRATDHQLRSSAAPAGLKNGLERRPPGDVAVPIVIPVLLLPLLSRRWTSCGETCGVGITAFPSRHGHVAFLKIFEQSAQQQLFGT